MENLIKALQIFLKYGNVDYPLHCEHDMLYVSSSYVPSNFSIEDVAELDELGFFISEETDTFVSFRYGSC